MSLSWIIIISSVTLTSTDFHFPIAVAVIGVLFFFFCSPPTVSKLHPFLFKEEHLESLQ